MGIGSVALRVRHSYTVDEAALKLSPNPPNHIFDVANTERANCCILAPFHLTTQPQQGKMSNSMNIDDFFINVDSTLASAAQAASAATINSAENRAFVEEVVARLAPMVSSYKEKLQARNIRVEVQCYPTGISFTMRYKDGGHHGLSLRGCQKDYRIQITTNFTNDDGKNYEGTDGLSYDKNSWNDRLFEDKLRKSINDFLYYASRHGGI